MRILITGGFGFVGGRLAVHLAQAGHQIVLGSRNASGAPVWLPQAEVAQIEWNDDVALEHCCDGVDVVIQAAGMNAQECAADPVAALAFNGLATARLVSAASWAGVQRFIYLSTAHVYASPLVGTITEETCPHNLHPYATSHLAGEQAVLGISPRGQMQCIVLRLSNAFGAPMYKTVNCWMLLVNDLCRQAVQTQKRLDVSRMELRSSGMQRRNFIPIQDVSKAILYLLCLPVRYLENIPYNVGADCSPTVWEMACHIQARCKVVLGFEPALTRYLTKDNEQSSELDFRSNRLRQSGFELGSEIDTEIDRLLMFCNAEF
jgi:UDP-glucose 4-epimerase